MNHKQSTPLDYIPRIRQYYQALGYAKPYVWAHFEDVPFCRLEKPLALAKIGIVTTAARIQPGLGGQGPGAGYNAKAKFYQVYADTTRQMPSLSIAHVAYDRLHSPADDPGAYFPLNALVECVKDGVIGAVSDRFYGLPTNRSQKTTMNVDCIDLVAMCQEDGLDGVVLVPNCPVCHQSVSLAARALEENGIPGVVVGCAKDIVEHVGVPRFVFNNFPLGNSAGRPFDLRSQRTIAELALNLLRTATEPRTTVVSPFEWLGDPSWQQDYSNADLLTREEIVRRKAEFDQARLDARKIREAGE